MQYTQQAPVGVVTQTQGAPVGVVTQTQGAPVTFVTQNHGPAVSNDKFHSGAAKQMLVLSSIQVAMGILCVIFGSVLAALAKESYWAGAYLGHIGYGIWVGLFYVLVGGIGIGAAKMNNSCFIISSMILHIICSVFWCGTLVGFTSIALIQSGIGCSYSYRSYSHTYWTCSSKIRNTFIAMDSLMLIMGLAEFVITIWGAVLCCGAICRCCRSVQRNPMVQYSAGPTVQNSQVVMYPGAPMTTYTTYPVVQGQQMAYPVAVQQPTGYVAQQQPTGYVAQQQPTGYVAQQQPTGYAAQQLPTGYVAQTAQPGGVMIQAGQPAGYVGQPPQPAYPNQQAPPSQPVGPPTYQAAAADQPPSATYPTKSC